MLRPPLDTLARFILPVCGSVAAWLVFAAIAPAHAQTTSPSVSTVSISQVNIPPDHRAEDQCAGANRASIAWGGRCNAPPASGQFRHPSMRSPAKKIRTIRNPRVCNRSFRGRSDLASAASSDRRASCNSSPRPSRSIRRWGRPSHCRLPSDCPRPTAPPALQWNNPYETGPAQPVTATGWYRFVPTGMIPWGPRTPLSQRAVGWGEPLLGTSWLNRPWSAEFVPRCD